MNRRRRTAGPTCCSAPLSCVLSVGWTTRGVWHGVAGAERTNRMWRRRTCQAGVDALVTYHRELASAAHETGLEVLQPL